MARRQPRCAESREGNPFYAMYRVRGRTLTEVIEEAATVSDRLALLSVMVRVAHTLAYAHERGVIHRDLKPDNILVGRHGEAIVLDWGIAKVHGVDCDDQDLGASLEALGEGNMTQFGEVLGTPTHMAPEQAAGRIDQIDERTDVFALGAILYHVLSGEPPYSGPTTMAIVLAARRGDPPPLGSVVSNISPALVAIVERAMAVEPSERFPTATALADALETLICCAVQTRESRVVQGLAASVAVLATALLLIAVVASIAMTPWGDTGYMSWVGLAFAIPGCSLSILEWLTKGKYTLSPLAIALALVTILVGVTNVALGEIGLADALMKPEVFENAAEYRAMATQGHRVVMSTLPVVLALTAIQVMFWAVARRAVSRSSPAESSSTA